MTTIAYDGRYIAIDSRITGPRGYIASDSFDKTFDHINWVIFWCGVVHTKNTFINAFIYSKEYELTEENGLYCFDKITGKVFEVWWEDKKFKMNELIDYDATGSGGDHAITAMDCGKSAVDAVRMAIKRDSHTGGEIKCFDTKTGKFIKVKQ